jgi:hypothetical protein
MLLFLSPMITLAQESDDTDIEAGYVIAYRLPD